MMPEQTQQEEVVFTPSPPSAVDMLPPKEVVATPTVEQEMEHRRQPPLASGVSVVDKEGMAGVLHAASDGMLSYQDAIKALITEGPTPLTIRQSAVATYMDQKNAVVTDFNEAAAKGMLVEAENLARYAEKIDAESKALTDQKALSVVTNQAALNLATSSEHVRTHNDPATTGKLSAEAAQRYAIKETVEQAIVKKYGQLPSGWKQAGVMGGLIAAPLVGGMAGGPVGVAVGLAADVGVTAAFVAGSMYVLPNVIEEVTGVPKNTLGYAEQIDQLRAVLRQMPPSQANGVVRQIADKYLEKAPFGDVMAMYDLVKLGDSFDGTEDPWYVPSLQTQELLDRTMIGAAAFSTVRTVSKAMTAEKMLADTAGGHSVGQLAGKNLTEGKNTLGISDADNAGFALSFDLKQYMPDSIVGASGAAQKELEDNLTTLLNTLNERININADASTVALRDFLQNNAGRANSSIASFNPTTGELLVQHSRGAPFVSMENALKVKAQLEKETGQTFEVVAANNGATQKMASTIDYRYEHSQALDDVWQEADAFGDVVKGDNLLDAIIADSSITHVNTGVTSANKDAVEVAKLLKQSGVLKNVGVVVVEDNNWMALAKKMLGKKATSEAVEKKAMELAGLAGKYDPYTNSIYLTSANKNSPSLILHELTHSRIGGLIEVVESGSKKAMAAANITGEQRAAVENLKTLYAHVDDWMRTAEGDTYRALKGEGNYYGFANVHEMVSEALTNGEFQKLLRSIPVEKEVLAEMKLTDLSFTGKIRTAWDAFVTKVAKLIGWDKGNDALSHVLDQSARLSKSIDPSQQNMVGKLLASGMSMKEIKTVILDDGLHKLSAGYYVKHSPSTSAVHDPKDIASRFGLGGDPIHRASEVSVHERTLNLMMESKDRVALDKFLRDGLKGLSRKEHARLVETLKEGDTLMKEFNVVELDARGLSSAKEQRAYYTYRTLSNINLALKNKAINIELTNRGFSQGYIKVGPITHFAPAKYIQPSSIEGKMAFNAITGKAERIDSTKLVGSKVVETAKRIEMGGGNKYTYFIGDSATLTMGKLRNQIPKREGSFRRIYTDDYFGRVVVDEMLNGEATTNMFHLRTSRSGRDMEKWAAGMNSLLGKVKSGAAVSLQDVEKAVGKWENPQEILNDISTGKWNNYSKFEHHYDRETTDYITSFTNALYDGMDRDRGRGIALKSIDDMGENVLDPYKAMEAEISNVSRAMNLVEWRDKWVDTWWNSFSHLVPDSLKVGGRTPLQIISDPRMQASLYTGSDHAAKFAESQRKYILMQLGVKTADESLIEAAMRRYTAHFSKDQMGGKALITAGHALRNADPLQFMRSFNFFTMLGAFNPAQLIVQSAGALNAVALHPVHGLTAAYTAPLLRIALMSDNPKVWERVASMEKILKVGLSDTQEFIDTVRAIRKSGLLSSIMSTSMHSAETGRHNLFTGTMNKLGEKSAMFFNRGEEFNRLVAFETARREWKDINKGMAWTTDTALKNILTRADDFTQNMTRSNLAFYQRGVLSIPGQFLQYNIKLAANLTGAFSGAILGKPTRGYTVGEASRILTGHIVAYGLAGNGLMAMADELTGGYEQLMGRKTTDDEKLAFSQGAIAAMINELAQLTMDEDLKLGVGSRLGVFEYYQKLADSIMAGDSSFWEVVLGPSYGSISRMGAMAAIVDPFVRKDFSVESFADVVQTVGKETMSSWRNATKAYYAAMHDNTIMNKTGEPMYSLTKGEVVFQALGMGSAAEAEYWRMKQSISENNAAVKELARSWLDTEATYYRVLNDGDKARAEKLAAFMASLHSPLPRGDAELFWNEVKKHQGQFNAAPFKDVQTKERARYLNGAFSLYDNVTSRSYGMEDQLPVLPTGVNNGE